MITKILKIILLFSIQSSIAQNTVHVSEQLMESIKFNNQNNLLMHIESLVLGIEQRKINKDLLSKNRAKLTSKQLKKLIDLEPHGSNKIDKQLLNLYPITKNKYYISISFSQSNNNSTPYLYYLVNLIAEKTGDKFRFSIPIDYLTRHWKKQKIGNINYLYQNDIDIKNAKLFNSKNSNIAYKLGVIPEELDFYMTDNYQEILRLLSFGYSYKSAGVFRDGYGVMENTIFAIENNEDFSHDIFHYYSSQVNKDENRNWIAEEGLAYLWGNAYYTDKKGQMIDHKRLVDELKNFLYKNSEANLYEIFNNNDKIFKNIAPEISSRSTIAGIIAKKIEQDFGKEGLLKLINAGGKNQKENFLRLTQELIQINKNNFDKKLRMLIKNY